MLQLKWILAGCVCGAIWIAPARASVYTPVTATARAMDTTNQLVGPGDGVSATDVHGFPSPTPVTYTGHAQVVWGEDRIAISTSMVHEGSNRYVVSTDTAQATAVFDLPEGASMARLGVIGSHTLTGPGGMLQLGWDPVPVPAGRYTFDCRAEITRTAGVDNDGYGGATLLVIPEPAAACVIAGIGTALLWARRRVPCVR